HAAACLSCPRSHRALPCRPLPFFFSSRRRHTRSKRDWSSDVCSSDLTQQKLQQETMKLFQKHGVNPLAGCLPVFVQMPILIAMYHAIMRTGAIGEHTFLWFQLGSRDPYFI